MENRHHEALAQIIKVLTKGQNIVALSPGSCVQSASLHATAEAANGFACILLLQFCRLI